MILKRTVLVALALVALGTCIGCRAGDKAPPATPSPGTIDEQNELREMVMSAAAAMKDVRSAAVAVHVTVERKPDPIEIDAEVHYVAPDVVWGVVFASWGGFDIFVRDDGMYFRPEESDWYQLEGGLVDLAQGFRIFGGGLVDLEPIGNEMGAPFVKWEDDDSVTIESQLPGYGFNGYVVRVVQSATLGGLTGYRANEVAISLDKASGLPTNMTISGTSPALGSGVGSSPFQIDLSFKDYDAAFGVPSPPEDAVVYDLTELAGATPVAPRPGTCGANAVVEAVAPPFGRVFHRRDELAVDLSYDALGCRNVSVTFEGEYLAGSPRYESYCGRQCGTSIGSRYDSGQVELVGTSGTVTVGERDGPFPKASSRDASSLEGFRLCRLIITLNDGALGGSFYETTIGECP